jgi:hypothetical protein
MAEAQIPADGKLPRGGCGPDRPGHAGRWEEVLHSVATRDEMSRGPGVDRAAVVLDTMSPGG